MRKFRHYDPGKIQDLRSVIVTTNKAKSCPERRKRFDRQSTGQDYRHKNSDNQIRDSNFLNEVVKVGGAGKLNKSVMMTTKIAMFEEPEQTSEKNSFNKKFKCLNHQF